MSQARAGRIFDAVLTVAKAIEKFQGNLMSLPPVNSGLCPLLKRQSWINGSDFMGAMKKVSLRIIFLARNWDGYLAFEIGHKSQGRCPGNEVDFTIGYRRKKGTLFQC